MAEIEVQPSTWIPNLFAKSTVQFWTMTLVEAPLMSTALSSVRVTLTPSIRNWRFRLLTQREGYLGLNILLHWQAWETSLPHIRARDGGRRQRSWRFKLQTQ